MSITSLNFTGCGLSAKAAEDLAESIKVSQLCCCNLVELITVLGVVIYRKN